MKIDYLTVDRLEKTMKMQLEILDFLADLLEYDSRYAAEHPAGDLPPLTNPGVLKSHFITQKKACESVLSLVARHLPRLKAEHDQTRAAEREKRQQQQAKPSPHPDKAQDKETDPLDPDKRETVENPPVNNPQAINLWEGSA